MRRFTQAFSVKSTAGAVFLVASLTLAANAADFYWDVTGPADWSVDGNWDRSGVPGSDDRVRISNAGTAFIDSDVGNIQRFELAQAGGSSGFLEIRNGGSLTMTANATAYVGARGPAVLTIQPGATLTQTSGNFFVGWDNNSSGTVIQNGGSVQIANNIDLAQAHSGSSGRYEIHAGTLDVGTFLQVGRRGTGEFIQFGGEVFVDRSSDALMVGAQGSSTGLYEMHGGELHVTRGPAYIGERDSSEGVFRQYDGTVTLGNQLSIGHSSGNQGLWEIHDGELNLSTNTSHYFYVGNAGEGRFVQTGGNVTQPAGGAMYLANSGTGRGYYDISGGTLDQGSLSIGHGGGTGEFTQTGGDVFARRDIRIARGGGTGSYTINGGTLTVSNQGGNDGRIVVGRDGSGATGTFTQSDGIVDAMGVRLANGGGITGTYEMSGGELRVPEIDRGSGTATFNWSGGTIRPRTGGNLAVDTPLTLSGTGATFDSTDADGTARTITVGSTMVGNGNLTKVGEGTLVFNSSQDYTGQTLVAAGTLRLAGGGGSLQTPSITVAPDATLQSTVSNWTYTGTLLVDDGALDAGNNTVNFDDGATVTLSGAGASVTAGRIRLGSAASVNPATFTQHGGAITLGSGDRDMMIGDSGIGHFTQSGGSVSVGRDTRLGNNAGSEGTLVLENDAQWTTDCLYVGNAGKGVLHVRDTAQLTVTTGGVDFRVGNASTGDGTIIQTGGTVFQTITGANYLGYASGSIGRYDISGGTLEQGSLSVGGNSGGTGIMVQTGGDVFARRDIRIARGGGTGSYTISGGTLTVDNSSGDDDGRIIVGRDGSGATGTFTQSGGIVDAMGVRLADASGTSGTYEVSGGELRTPEIAHGTGSAAFNWSGGTIRPRTGGDLAVTTRLTLSGTGATFNSSDAGGTPRTITVSEAIEGGGSLTKTGAGQLTLSAANSYTGQTTVDAGAVHVTGSLANNGSSHVRVASAGDAFGPADPTIVRRVAGGGSFVGLGSPIMGAGTLDTTADLPAGTNQSGGPLDVGMAWRTISAADTAAFPARTDLLSDVLRLDGMDGGDGQTDPFVLQMSYDASLVQPYHDPAFLVWLDQGEWVNAVHGNFGLGGSAVAGYEGSWTDFTGDFGSDLHSLLGSWGVDTTASTAWAVLNHNSQFAVLAIPEPGTWLLLLTAMASGLLVRRRR